MENGIDAMRAVLLGGSATVQHTVNVEKENVHSMKLAKESRKSSNGEKYKVVEVCNAVLPVLKSPTRGGIIMAKKTKRRREWTKEDVREIKGHSRARTPVAKMSKLMKRTAGALRQKAWDLGLALGHRR